MRRELTPQERAFVENFSRGPALEEEEQVSEQRSASRWRILFLLYMGTILTAPFLLSAAFLYALNRIESLFGANSFSYLRETLSESEIRTLGAGAGIEQLNGVLELYDRRALIVGALFASFFSLALLSIAVKMALGLVRKNHG